MGAAGRGGRCGPRPEGTVNADLPTGAIEVGAASVEVLNEAEPSPFPLDDRADIDEVLRLRHRYLDLRRAPMQRNLRVRAEVNRAMREAMRAQDFVEIETPMLIASTPEGARDFVVPSRLRPGAFYALPQSPQLFKQLLMVGGLDRYFQIARCLRDEDLRADRQFEFMQLDVEMSFADQEDVLDAVSLAVLAAAEAVRPGEAPATIPRMTWLEAMERYGSDKPDTRFGMELVELTEVFEATEFQRVRGRGRDQGDPCRGRGRHAAGRSSTRSTDRAKALGRARAGVDARARRWRARVARREVLAPTPSSSAIVDTLGRGARRSGADRRRGPGDGARRAGPAPARPRSAARFARVSRSRGSSTSRCSRGSTTTGRPMPAHHAFTAPHPDDIDRLESDPLSVRSQSYDLVLNGWELGSGSVRIHRPDMQQRIFSLIGIEPDEAQQRFGFLLDAFRFGAPPHAGFAVGIDRLVAILAGEENIREVIAFPKTQSGVDPLTNAPTSDRRPTTQRPRPPPPPPAKNNPSPTHTSDVVQLTWPYTAGSAPSVGVAGDT